MQDRPRVNVMSGVELETDSGRNSANGLIGAVIACLVIGFVVWVLFGV